MRSFPVLRSHGFPVVFDVTHSVQRPGGLGDRSGGDAHFIDTLAPAGVAAGVDGLFMEVHENPARALSDGPNAYRLGRLEEAARAPAAGAAGRARAAHEASACAAQVLEIEAQAILDLRERLGAAFERAVQAALRLRRPRGRHGHGQERADRPEALGHARLDRHALALPSPGRSHPRRPGPHRDGRRGGGHLLQRRHRGDRGAAAQPQAPRRAAGRPDGRPESDPGQAADVHLDVGVRQEACPLGLAPTASPPPRWPWATPWPWCCWSGAASPSRTSPCCTRAAASARSCCGSRT